MIRENPIKGCTGKTENGRESGCSKRKRRINNSDNKVARDSDQHGGNRNTGKRAHRFGGLERGSKKSAYPLTRLIINDRDKNH